MSVNSALPPTRAPGSAKAPTPTALLAVLEENPTIRDSVLPALRGMPLLPHGCGIAVHYFASRIDASKADQFLDQINNPVAAGEGHPVNQLREVLMRLRGQGGQRKQTYLLAIAIKAWNAFRQGRPMKLLRYAGDREAFPRFDAEPDWGPLSHSIAPAVNAPRTKRSALQVRVAMITPEMAEQLLEDRGPNRHVV